MLDKRTHKLLDVILQACGDDGAYKIVEIHDLINGMLPKYKVDTEILAQMIKFLVATELIDIKYNDDSVYCIGILPKGRIYEEAKVETRQSKAIGKGLTLLIIIGSFIAAFAGAVVANIILFAID